MKKLLIAVLVTLSLSLVSPLASQTVYADCPTSATANSAKDQVLVGVGTAGSDCTGNGVTDFISATVNIISLIVGIAAIIMVVVSGFKYITSAGDTGKVASAKNTLIYALVGVAVAALAQFLVHFVFTTTTQAPCNNGYYRSADGKNCIKRGG